MDKKIAEYLLKEINLQTLSSEYAGAIKELCESVLSQPSVESAYCYGYIMATQRCAPQSVIRIMTEGLKADWDKIKNINLK